MENKSGWEGSVVIPDVEGDSLTMEVLQIALIGIVDEHKLPNLVLVDTVSPKMKNRSYSHQEGNV
jgi:hypothetical protein